MTTTYTFPILKSLDVTPQVAYEILIEGVSVLRIMYASSKASGEIEKALEFYDKVQQGERLLHFMRLNLGAC
jgi:hypothetical protein